MIIDAHIHIDQYGDSFKSHKERLDNLKILLKKAKVNKAILIQDIEAKGNPLTTKEILDLIKKEKNIYVVGAVKITHHAKKDLQELEQNLKEKKIIGIKLYPGYEPFYPKDKRCDPIYDL